MITIRQIAKEAGVSKSTVSRYLNDGYVSEKTAEKIKKVIEENNYSPNEFARNLKYEKSKFIGVVIPRIDSPSTTSMLAGVEKISREHDYQILISNTDLDDQREIESIYSLVQNKVAGIIVFATKITDEHLALQNKIEIPIIFVGQQHPDIYSVIHDNFQAGQLLASNLLKFNHQKVRYIGVSKTDYSVGVQRKKGVVSTFIAQGIQVEEIESSFRTMANYELAKQLLQDKTYTLYVTATDNMAIGFYRAAFDLGLIVGQDISIAGFGGYMFSEFLTPPLTTIDFHHEKVGEQAMANLLDLIVGNSTIKESIVPVSYQERKSVIKL
ncbi:LacI family DNA-binding transcriptional regulator [Vagococcus zengguangii]|uniref:LacI family transcriptional regulator n=1 Tax=Vagococcus zengguangii TaxID=2571750 RepID=A0A4D7CPB3_9ENTE|nr:LacI family DNA-binding transcriptional regulator [Vagococcus zengguangii]QCI85908.1 LacI family transcriptional regulator [Vagococcus zengguangii]TLG78398.1 LacI family transcriptional regulator [Vagococcus zengguangii]